MIQGKQKEQSANTGVTKYVGLTKVEVRAINPSRSELNKLLGKEDGDDDKEIEYLGEDKEGNKRLRLAFWLYDEKLDKYFTHSFNITDKVRVSNDGSKTQYINSTCDTGWADDEENLVDFFKHFIEKRSKEILGDKTYRPALGGEEELGILIKAWLGRLSWYDVDTKVEIDTKALFNEDYSSLRDQIDGNYDTPFVILVGVRTDESDFEKQYQQVYGKAFLPQGLMQNIIDNKFNDWSKKTYQKFVDNVEGEYGFKAFFELEAIKEYNKEDDPAAQPSTQGVTATNAKY